MNKLMRQQVLRTLIGLPFAMLITFVATSTSIAQEPGVANSSPVERYLNRETAVVAWVDLSKIDLFALSEFGRRLNSADSGLMRLQPIRDALVQLGVTRIYFVGDESALIQGPKAFVVPVSAEKAVQVKLVLGASMDNAGTAIIDGDAVLFGDKASVAQLQTKLDGKPEAAFLRAANGINQSHGLVIRTAASVLKPLIVALPKVFVDDATLVERAAKLLSKIRSVTVSCELPPANGRLQIETDSAEAANQLAALVNEATKRQIGELANPLQFTSNDLTVSLSTASSEQMDAVIASLKYLMLPVKMRAQRQQTLNSLKHIALAMHNFHDTYSSFPPQALADDEGKRLLSWRVLILPFLDQADLYQQFHLDEPWDSDHNRKLIEKMPDVYRDLSAEAKMEETGKTRIVAPLTEASIFGRIGTGVEMRSVTDGTSNTLLVVEVSPEKAVIWTKPDDVEIDPENPLGSLINANAEGFHVCMADGASRFIPRSIDLVCLRALLTIDGGEVIDIDKFSK